MEEEGGEACKKRRRWEEGIYWAHFKFTHFSQFLLPGSLHRLVIPKDFTQNLKRKLPDIVTLKGPSGVGWKVGIMRHDDTLFFDAGWGEFARENFLEENDLLIFKYNGESCFDVLMFDGVSMCEKSATYFVRKCEHEENEKTECQTKGKPGKSSEGVVFGSGSRVGKSVVGLIDQIDGPLVGSFATKAKGKMMTATSKKTTATSKKTEVSSEHVKPIHVTPSARSDELFTSYAEEMDVEPDDQDLMFTLLNNEVVNNVSPSSNGRVVTYKAKRAALQLAQDIKTSDGFIIIMKPTHVDRKFFLSIPRGWVVKHLHSLLNNKVMLRIKDRIWKTTFFYHRPRSHGGLSSGWKNFVVDNHLQRFDVCVFEPVIPMMNGPLILDVIICRASEDALPLSPSPVSCRGLLQEPEPVHD